VQVMAKAIIQSGSEVGGNTIINTRTSIDHDCRIGHHIYLASGVILCGNLCIEELGHVGTGATTLQSVRVGAQVLVNAGTLIKSDIEGTPRDKGKIT
jgi:acyl-[acyl carrier protein]--UDP-N-acetylglucosamine O-acyltransferase